MFCIFRSLQLQYLFSYNLYSAVTGFGGNFSRSNSSVPCSAIGVPAACPSLHPASDQSRPLPRPRTQNPPAKMAARRAPLPTYARMTPEAEAPGQFRRKWPSSGETQRCGGNVAASGAAAGRARPGPAGG